MRSTTHHNLNDNPHRQHRRRRGRARAFTLLEILVVIAIIGMITGAMIVGTARLADQGPTTPHAVFWNAVTNARKQALYTGRDVRLAYTPATTGENGDTPASLTATWQNGGSQSFPFTKMGDVLCEFLATQKGGSAILIGGELVETQTIPYMTFYGDGTCTACRIQIRVGGTPETFAIDPWTCAEMLTPKEGTP